MDGTEKIGKEKGKPQTKDSGSAARTPGTVKVPETGDGGSYRYWVRILKGSALPMLYVIVSFFMLRKYVLEYTGYYDYNTPMILTGFVLGIMSMSGLTAYNIFRASKARKKGVELKSVFIFAVYIPIILVILVLALIYGISTVWQFSIGFFVTALLPPVMVIIAELIFRARFLVFETDLPKRTSRLLFVPNEE